MDMDKYNYTFLTIILLIGAILCDGWLGIMFGFGTGWFIVDAIKAWCK